MADAGRRPLDEAWLASLAPPLLSPRLFRALDPLVVRRWLGLESERAAAMRAVYRAFERELPRFPELADVGFSLLAPDRSDAERKGACTWLTLFPSEEMVAVLSQILLDDAAPVDVRSQAAWSLGFRQAQERHDALWWSPETVARANDALFEAWQRGLSTSLPMLAPATRHVDDASLFAWMCAHLDEALPALEAFATPELARALLARLETIPDEHVHRALRLAAHVLGKPAAEALVAYGSDGRHLQAHEALFCALTLEPSLALPPLDEAIATMAFPGPTSAKREAYLASPGGIPHVRALRVARTTATIAPASRAGSCKGACLDFELLARIDAIHESYLHAMWRHMAYGTAETAPEQVIACVRHSPGALSALPALAGPCVVALVASGRFHEAVQTAAAEGVAARGAWEAARSGRPFLALRLAASVRARTPDVVAAEALASFLAGRIDLAEAALAGFEPDADVLWDAHDAADRVARAVIERDLVALASLCVPPPPGADPDDIDLALLSDVERRLRPRLRGTCIYLAGFEDRGAAVAALEAQGARVVDAPFGRVDLCVVPDERPDTRIDARLVVRSVPVLPLSRALHGAQATITKNEDTGGGGQLGARQARPLVTQDGPMPSSRDRNV